MGELDESDDSHVPTLSNYSSQQMQHLTPHEEAILALLSDPMAKLTREIIPPQSLVSNPSVHSPPHL